MMEAVFHYAAHHWEGIFGFAVIFFFTGLAIYSAERPHPTDDPDHPDHPSHPDHWWNHIE